MKISGLAQMRVMTNAAMAIHEELIGQGIETESDEYYNNINKRMREYFPQKFAQDSADKSLKLLSNPSKTLLR